MARGIHVAGRRVSAFSRYKRPLEAGIFIEVPLLVFGSLLWSVLGHGGGGDFAIFRRAGAAVLHGQSPYVQPTAALLGSNDRFVYPMPFALPFVPFAAVPAQIAAILYLCCAAAAVLAALWLLGVRDYRCYGVALMGSPVYGAIGIGTIGPFLLLLLALGWRYRDRTIAGVPIALVAAAKLFVWPTLVWLVVTRRWRAAGAATATVASVVLAWSVLDPEGLRRYPQTIRVLDEVERWKSYSSQTFAISLGLSSALADILVVILGLLTVAAIALAVRSRDQHHAFGIAVIGALVATPILWLHYLILLLIPVALTRPRLSPLWFLPVLLWVTPHPESLGLVSRMAIVLAVIAATAAATSGLPQYAAARSAVLRISFRFRQVGRPRAGWQPRPVPGHDEPAFASARAS